MENSTTAPSTQLSLQDQIALRIQTAKDKQIFQKAVAVAIKHGAHTEPSYRDDGIYFYNNQWLFKEGRFSVRNFTSCCSYTTYIEIMIDKKTVFYGEAKIDNSHIFRESPNEQIKTYVSGADWEQWLDQLAAPMIDQFRKSQKKEEVDLKKRYGL